MKTIKIGDRSEVYIAKKSEASYLLEKGDVINAPDDNYGIYTAGGLGHTEYHIDGKIIAHSTMRIDATGGKDDIEIEIGKSGRLISQSFAIELNGSGETIRNDGRISAAGGDGMHVIGANTITNNGDITASAAGIYTNAMTGDETEIRNTGTISGLQSIRTGLGDDKVTNSGTLKGDVLLSSGEDTFVFRGGRVDGDVAGGADDDTYILHKPGLSIYENSNAGQGNDLVKAWFSLSLADNVERLTLMGKGNLTGIGNDDANTITGNAGRNTLFGMEGNDSLNGGKGDDVLIGGMGEDEFHFVRGTGTDIVADFEKGTDFLDLGDLKGVKDFDDLIANHISQKGNDLWITYGDDTVVLANTVEGDLSSTYVLFA